MRLHKRPAGPGQIYCPLADCPACKELAPAYTLLDGPETKLWRSMRDGGTLRRDLIDASLADADG